MMKIITINKKIQSKLNDQKCTKLLYHSNKQQTQIFYSQNIRMLKNIIYTTIIPRSTSNTYIFKRTMLGWTTKKTSNILFNGISPTRSMGTWNNVIHTGIKGSYPKELEIDSKTGLKIMPDHDFSGVSHLALVDIDSKGLYYLCYGKFTTSPAPYEGRKPLFVSAINLIGQDKYQYFHLYPEPRLLRKSAVTIDDITSMFLCIADYKSFLEKIKTITPQ